MQGSELFRWLREKNVRTDCSAFGSPAWEPGDIIAPPATPEGGGTVVGGPSFPLVQIICPSCAYVMHFASPRVGLPVAAALLA